MRAVDAGAISRATIIAMTRSRQRLPEGPKQTIKTNVAQRAEHGRHMPVRQGAAHHNGFLIGRRDPAALEQRAQAFDDLGRPVGQVRDGALLDLAAVPIALPQQDGGRRVPVRDGFDIHGATMPRIAPLSNDNIINYMATFLWPFSQNSSFFNRLSISKVGSSVWLPRSTDYSNDQTANDHGCRPE